MAQTKKDAHRLDTRQKKAPLRTQLIICCSAAVYYNWLYKRLLAFMHESTNTVVRVQFTRT